MSPGEPAATLDDATRPVEEVDPDPLALDSLSPQSSRPMADTSSQTDPLGLDPLGPIPRFHRAG